MWPTLAIFAAVFAIGFLVLWRGERRQRLGEAERHEKTLRELTAKSEQKKLNFRAEQETLFNSMIEGVLVLDGEGQVRLVNDAFQDLFNLHQNLKGRSLMEAVRLHEIEKIYNQTLVVGQVHGYNIELPALQDRSLQVNSTVILDQRSERRGMILVFHDITRIRELESTRREFVANVSHELRTPLSLIKGYVETLIDGARNEPEVALKFLNTIEKHADRLTFLIEDLLTLSHLESGQLVVNPRMTDLKNSVERVCEDLSKKAAKREIDLVNAVGGQVMVAADGDRLQQVLFNLIDNAIKCGRSSGDVRITAAPGEDGFVEVCVADDGAGIAPEACERLFERFFRADKARSRDQGGTGLGLAIVKHIIQSHGGEVRVESQVGTGTSFFFTLNKELF